MKIDITYLDIKTDNQLFELFKVNPNITLCDWMSNRLVFSRLMRKIMQFVFKLLNLNQFKIFKII